MDKKKREIDNSCSTTTGEGYEDSEIELEDKSRVNSQRSLRNQPKVKSKKYRDMCLSGEIGEDMYLRYLAWVNLLHVQDVSTLKYNGKEGIFPF